LPLVQISGAYFKPDKDGKLTKAEVPFQADNVLLSGPDTDKLLASGNFMLASGKFDEVPANVGMLNVVWNLFPFVVLMVPLAIISLIILVVRRAMKKRSAAAGSPARKPDHFWRWFAVTVLAIIAIPFFIAIVGLLAAIAIPNFVKARQVSQQNTARQRIQDGWRLWQEGKLADAEIKFEQAVQLVPDDANAWNGLGWAQFNSGNSAAAETSFQKAITIETNQPGALNGLGQVYLSQRKYDDAEKYLLRAAPQAPAAWYGLARLYLIEGKFEPAEKWAQDIVDSGQADDTAKKMLEAAKAKKLSDGLRMLIEPPPAPNAKLPVRMDLQTTNGSTRLELQSTNPIQITASSLKYDVNTRTATVSGDFQIKSHPAESSAVSSAADFGPVIERVLETTAGPDWNWFDLDKGQSVSAREMATNEDDAANDLWKRAHGVDVGATITGQQRGLVGWDFICIPAKARLWDSASAQSVISLVDETRPAAKVTPLLAKPDELPATFAFKTREGAVGILQITGFSDQPSGVKIRYKLAQIKAPESARDRAADRESWSPALMPGQKPNLQGILDDAKGSMERQAYEESLQRRLWYFRHAPEYGDLYQDVVRTTSALADWVELGRRYPRAKEALLKIRDDDTRLLEAGKGCADLFDDVQAINRELLDDDATFALFKTLREKDPQLADQCYFRVERLLVAHGEYQWCYDHMGDAQYRFDTLKRLHALAAANEERMAVFRQRARDIIDRASRTNGWTNQPPYPPADSLTLMKKDSDDRFVTDTRQLLEILVATDHAPAAEKIQTQAVAELDDARLLSAVSDAKEKIRKSSPQNQIH